jgi:plastocyanin
MVMIVAPLVGVAALLARVSVTAAVPMDYGSGSSSSMAAPPSYQTSYGSSSSSSSHNSGNMYAPPPPPPSYTSSMSSSYGSGSMSWNNGGYDSCVQQCVAQFGTPSTMYMPPSMTASSGSYGSGATHTVWVAPTQGVLRYVPFAVNASVGDTVKFIWGANVHTVTKSSQLDLCNKTGNQPFASGEQNKTFVFTQVVNDTSPTFYYCGTPTHCEKGMFGIINPPNAFGQPSCASSMMPSLASQYPSTKAAMTYAMNVSASQPAAGAWGGSIDMSKMPSWAQSYTAENIAYTRSFLAMNPETISQSGAVDLSPLANNAIMIPTDVAAAAHQNDATNTSASAAAPSSTAGTASGATSQSGKNGAGALASPQVAVALVAVAAAFFAL